VSAPSVLYDAPGPAARRRNTIYTVLFAAALIALGYGIYRGLDAKGQWAWALWEPFFQSSTWTSFLLPGLVATIKAAQGYSPFDAMPNDEPPHLIAMSERYIEASQRHARLQREAFSSVDKAWAARTITSSNSVGLVRSPCAVITLADGRRIGCGTLVNAAGPQAGRPVSEWGHRPRNWLSRAGPIRVDLAKKRGTRGTACQICGKRM
jgi:quinol monooxygenase YgiN